MAWELFSTCEFLGHLVAGGTISNCQRRCDPGPASHVGCKKRKIGFNGRKDSREMDWNPSRKVAQYARMGQKHSPGGYHSNLQGWCRGVSFPVRAPEYLYCGCLITERRLCLLPLCLRLCEWSGRPATCRHSTRYASSARRPFSPPGRSEAYDHRHHHMSSMLSLFASLKHWEILDVCAGRRNRTTSSRSPHMGVWPRGSYGVKEPFL